MSDGRKSLDIVTSALNEELCLPELFERLSAVMDSHPEFSWRLIVCDNGSTDSTWSVIQNLSVSNPQILGIRMARMFPFDSALTCGLDLASADAVVIMCSDLQDPPEVIHQMLVKYNEGFDQVVVRIRSRPSLSFVRSFLSNIFYSIANRLTNNMIPKGVSDFRLMSRKAYTAVRSLRERNRFLRGLAAWTGFNTAQIEIDRPERFGGDSKFLTSRLSKVIQWAFSGIFAHTSAPLIWVSTTGFFFSLISTLATIIFAIFWIFKSVPFAGFGTIVGLVSLGFSITLLSIGIIAQYIALIYDEVKARPLYIISQRTDDKEASN